MDCELRFDVHLQRTSICFVKFVEGVYRQKHNSDGHLVQWIVDVGANVGYSVLWLAARFHTAKILAFDTVPEHVTLLEKRRSQSTILRIELALSGRS
jgi:hypothetical protein